MRSIIVTGAYGFIGSHFVKFLNKQGITDIIVSDYLANGKQFVNLQNAQFVMYVHPDKVVDVINKRTVSQVFHFGAVSDTTCWDGELMMKRNYEYSTSLITACHWRGIPISYSSSASVYGNGDGPLNLYAYSKYLVDKFVTDLASDRVQGFRYFNVYAEDDSEWHKGDQASPFYKFKQQALETGTVRIFEGSENFKRDFVHVDRVCEVQWEMAKRNKHGIFDLGTGRQMSFYDVATKVAETNDATVTVVPFPEQLRGHYQVSTLADMSYL